MSKAGGESPETPLHVAERQPTQPNMTRGTPMIDSVVVSHASSSTVGKSPAPRVTRLQQKRKATEAQSDRESQESDHEAIPKPKTAPLRAQIEKTKVSARKDDSKTKKKGKEPASKVGDKEDTPNAGVEKPLADAQGKAREEAQKTDAMWARIAKAVDSAMAAEAPGEIKQHQVDYILNAIMACALSKMQAEVSGNNLASFLALNQATTITTTNAEASSPTPLPNKPNT